MLRYLSRLYPLNLLAPHTPPVQDENTQSPGDEAKEQDSNPPEQEKTPPLISYKAYVAQMGHTSSPPMLIYHPKTSVYDRRFCPNPACKLAYPHSYQPPPTRPPPPNTPELHIGRFEIPEYMPFPGLNCFKITGVPPFALANGQIIYTRQFGTTQLVDANRDSETWVEYRLIEETEGQRRYAASLLVRKEWCSNENSEWSDDDDEKSKPNFFSLYCNLGGL